MLLLNNIMHVGDLFISTTWIVKTKNTNSYSMKVRNVAWTTNFTWSYSCTVHLYRQIRSPILDDFLLVHVCLIWNWNDKINDNNNLRFKLQNISSLISKQCKRRKAIVWEWGWLLATLPKIFEWDTKHFYSEHAPGGWVYFRAIITYIANNFSVTGGKPTFEDGRI